MGGLLGVIEKQKMREAVESALLNNDLNLIDKEILNSKYFIQKIYRKDFNLFNKLLDYTDNDVIWNEVLEEQEKIELGNAFNNFCQIAKLVKPGYKVDLDNLTNKEKYYFKAFNEIYEMKKEMQDCFQNILNNSDYKSLDQVLETISKTLEVVKRKGYNIKEDSK